MTDFVEGNWSMDPAYPCPQCGKPVAIASNLRKFGTHAVRFCLGCKECFVNGEPAGPISVYGG